MVMMMRMGENGRHAQLGGKTIISNREGKKWQANGVSGEEDGDDADQACEQFWRRFDAMVVVRKNTLELVELMTMMMIMMVVMVM